MTSPGSLNKLLLLCGISKDLQVAIFQKLLTLGWTAFKKVAVEQINKLDELFLNVLGRDWARDPEQAHEALLCGKSVVVRLEDHYLQEQCQQWLHLAKYCTARTFAFHITDTPIPEILQEFRQPEGSSVQDLGCISQLIPGDNEDDLDMLWTHLGYGRRIGRRQTHRIYAPASREVPNLWLNRREAELAEKGIHPRDLRKFPLGCPEWDEVKKYIKTSKLKVKAEAKTLELQERQRQRTALENQQRIALENRRNDELVAAKERIEASLREPEDGQKEAKKQRRFAALFDDANAEAEMEEATQRELREGLQDSKRKRRFAALFDDTEAEAGSPPETSLGSANRRKLKDTREPLPPRILEPTTPLDQQLGNSRPVLLFDLNGTLTSHTHQRKSSGQNLMRPGIYHLRRLQDHFNLGIYSSASLKTVADVREMLENAAGGGPPLFPNSRLILHRMHTIDASVDHKLNGGKDWDTMKPLERYFSRMHQTLLVDDDSFKACQGEEKNMILMPRWEEEPWDNCIEGLVETLLSAIKGLTEQTDLREATGQINLSLKKRGAPA